MKAFLPSQVCHASATPARRRHSNASPTNPSPKEESSAASQVYDAFCTALTASQVGMYGRSRPPPPAAELAAFYDLLQHYLKFLAARLPDGDVTHASHHSLQVGLPTGISDQQTNGDSGGTTSQVPGGAAACKKTRRTRHHSLGAGVKCPHQKCAGKRF